MSRSWRAVVVSIPCICSSPLCRSGTSGPGWQRGKATVGPAALFVPPRQTPEAVCLGYKDTIGGFRVFPAQMPSKERVTRQRCARGEEDSGHTWLSPTLVGLGGQRDVPLSTPCTRRGAKSPALPKPAAACFPGESC